MAIYIPHRCPKCFENVTLIQAQYKGVAFKGPAKGQCLNYEEPPSIPIHIAGGDIEGDTGIQILLNQA